MFVNSSIDNVDVLLRKNIYGFRKRVYDIENNLIKCMNTYINIHNGPMWSRLAQTLYFVQW